MIIRHSRGEYPVLFETLDTCFAGIGDKAFFVTDEHVDRLYGERIEGPKYVAPPGEHSKSFEQLEGIAEWLASSGATRKSLLVAFGGGVIGDLAGFAAAAYQRGIAFVQVPTTLLSQVDSSVGGKVAIDLKAGKNLFGAFHAPAKVWIALETLETLDARQFAAGAAEIWKTGAILDKHLLERLHREPLHLRSPDLRDIVARCIQLKASVVEEDEFETTGRRAILNFGHTIGHAIEQVTGYGPILHGEAVSLGMIAEGLLGERIGLTPKGFTDRLRKGLESQGLPVDMPSLDRDALLVAMRRDKKVVSGGLAFALVIAPGDCKLVCDVAEQDVLAAMAEL